MATETLRPNAAGDLNQCRTNTGAGSSNNYTYVDESSANDADYIASLFTVGYYDLYNLPSTSIPAGSTINKITFYGRFKRDASGGLGSFYYKTDGTDYLSALTLTTSFAEYSLEKTTNPKTSAAWTIDDINGLQIGAYLSSGSDGKVYYYGYCSQLWIVIEYTEAANAIPVFMHYYQKMMR